MGLQGLPALSAVLYFEIHSRYFPDLPQAVLDEVCQRGALDIHFVVARSSNPWTVLSAILQQYYFLAPHSNERRSTTQSRHGDTRPSCIIARFA